MHVICTQKIPINSIYFHLFLVKFLMRNLIWSFAARNGVFMTKAILSMMHELK